MHEYVLAYVKHTKYDLTQSRVFYFGCDGDGDSEIKVRLFESAKTVPYESRGSLTVEFLYKEPDVLELVEAAHILQDSMQREEDTCTCAWFCQNLCRFLGYHHLYIIPPVPAYRWLLNGLVNTLTGSSTHPHNAVTGFGTDFIRNGRFHYTPFIEEVYPIYWACVMAGRGTLYEKAGQQWL